jgi:translation elongation factor EF-G
LLNCEILVHEFELKIKRLNLIGIEFRQVALKQAWQEDIKPILVLNKIDRIILELKLTPLDAYVHLTQVLEKVSVKLS